MEEIWKDVRGYEGLYAVSNWGRVKSLGNDKSRKEKILRLSKYGRGYLKVNLWKEGKRTTYIVHRLVLSTFSPVENMDELDVNHIDEVKTNNNLNNLEWCTHKENINHGTRNDRVAEKMTNGKTSLPIAQLTLDGKFIKAWKSIKDAQRLGGFTHQRVNECCKGKRKTYKGYRWMYLSEYMDKYCGIIE